MAEMTIRPHGLTSNRVFHVPAMLHWIDTEIFMNGCFVSDDRWGLKTLGMGGLPKQVMFFVHSHQGVSARYIINL